MPAKPRLANVSTPVRAVANASMSRTGREEETNNVVPFLMVAATVRARTGSDHSVIFSNSFVHLSENFCHFSSHSESASFDSRIGICVKRLSAFLSVSTVAIRESITTCLSADAMKLFIERESVVRPITMTVRGVKSFAIVVDAKNKDACATDPLSDSGSSLISGQPS